MMRSVEMFVGAGGLGIGVSKVGFHPVAVIDWDRSACDTIRENQERGLQPLDGWPLHECDIRGFDFKQIGGPGRPGDRWAALPAVLPRRLPPRAR